MVEWAFLRMRWNAIYVVCFAMNCHAKPIRFFFLCTFFSFNSSYIRLVIQCPFASVCVFVSLFNNPFAVIIRLSRFIAIISSGHFLFWQSIVSYSMPWWHCRIKCECFHQITFSSISFVLCFFFSSTQCSQLQKWCENETTVNKRPFDYFYLTKPKRM